MPVLLLWAVPASGLLGSSHAGERRVRALPVMAMLAETAAMRVPRLQRQRAESPIQEQEKDRRPN